MISSYRVLILRLAQDLGLESQVAVHLAETYGDRAFAVGTKSFMRNGFCQYLVTGASIQ